MGKQCASVAAMSLCTSCAYMKMSSGMCFLMIRSGQTSPRRFLIFSFFFPPCPCHIPSLGRHHCLKWKTAPSGVSDHQDVSMKSRSMKENKTKIKTFTAEALYLLSKCQFYSPARLQNSLLLLFNFRGACFKFQSVCWQLGGGLSPTGRGASGVKGGDSGL